MDNFEYKIENYLAEYCREERQYALFLNELLNNKDSADLRQLLGISNDIMKMSNSISLTKKKF